jgi:carbonic anhydrase/acetyltransferase-like protein (isoleucine patch superfamily)
MPAFSLGDRTPKFDASKVYIAHNATVIGAATLGDGCSLWFNAVLRADNETITLAENVNVQEGAVLHADPGFPLSLARDVTIGHLAMVHGCTIGENTLIGINAVVLNGAVIGKNCVIGANALVAEGKVIPDNSLVVGSPGKVARSTTADEAAGLRNIAARYVERGVMFKRELRLVSDPAETKAAQDDQAFWKHVNANNAP